MCGPLRFHCDVCTRSFKSKATLNQHIQDHPNTTPKTLIFSGCEQPLPDSLNLEKQRIQAEHSCQANGAVKDLNGVSAELYTCDRCPNTFKTYQEYSSHRAFPKGPCCDYKQKPKSIPSKQQLGKCIDAGKPEPSVNEVLAYDGDSSDTPSNLSKNSHYCHDCKKAFTSQATFDRHFLACVGSVSHLDNIPSAPSSETLSIVNQPSNMPPQTVERNMGQPVLVQEHALTLAPLTAHSSTPSRSPALTTTSAATTSDSKTLLCGINGCQKTYRSAQGLKAHQTDAHSIGGQSLDLHGKDSWMLSQKMREQLKAQGLLRQPPNISQGSLRGRGRGGRAASMLAQPPLPPQASMPRPPARQLPSSQGPSSHYTLNLRAPAQQAPARASASLSISRNIGGLADMEQAKLIQGQIMRLLIQSDIYIHHDGKITVNNINWTRISVDRQPDVVTMFDQMCHLPKVLQSIEYIPPPKAFKAEYTAQYPVLDFNNSPERDQTRPGLDVVALSCSKIILANGCREVVKIAAVDVTTCRILMSNFVCTNSDAQVADWRTKETGLSSFVDMEKARKAGYKIFKGWAAARSALWKFIDRETIIVGHNLRCDLDALRMVHGRAVDIAKVVEKAAKGPLSTAQLSLESLARNYPGITLKSDDISGQNVLVGAFAVRELGLWIIKNQDKLDRDARQKSLEYQSVMGTRG